MANAGGRPTKYREDYPKRAYKLCLLGATDKQLADFFEIEESTLNNWKLEYPEFMESLKAGKSDADAVIAQSLFHRAKGYSHPEDKIFNEDGEAMIVPTVKHYAPDTTACIFWLKNRQKDKWRDRTETGITGADGTDLTINVNITED